MVPATDRQQELLCELMQQDEQMSLRPCRRYIERFNAKLREKAKKDEVKRLKAFVETAFNQDPRMVRRRQAEKAAR